MNNSQVKIRDLFFSYADGKEELSVLEDINLAVEQGEFISIIGPSGCGKTSLLRLIAGLEMPTGGILSVAKNADRNEQLKFGFVFQSAALFPWLSVADNIAKPLVLAGTAKSERNARVQSLLQLMELDGFGHKFPHQLSGGMQQRVSIARALAPDPDLLLMDEPFGSLDEITRERMNLELYDLWKGTGKTICFVTHSITEAAFLSSRIVVMSARPGRIQAVLSSPLPKMRNAELLESSHFNEFVAEIRQAMRA